MHIIGYLHTLGMTVSNEMPSGIKVGNFKYEFKPLDKIRKQTGMRKLMLGYFRAHVPYSQICWLNKLCPFQPKQCRKQSSA